MDYIATITHEGPSEPAITELIARTLNDCEVLIARRGARYHRCRPGLKIDLPITDFVMPSMTGEELLGYVHQRRPHLRALVVTGM